MAPNWRRLKTLCWVHREKEIMMATFAVVVSLCSLIISMYTWGRSRRPIVTVAVKTHSAGPNGIGYNLVVRNSGATPARNIEIRLGEEGVAALDCAFGKDASEENKRRWLACFNETILILHSNDQVSCSFGTTMENNTGFWKPRATIPVRVSYEGWVAKKYALEGFWNKYDEPQKIRIVDSDSFTGYSWG
jgi:hypothetical protein